MKNDLAVNKISEKYKTIQAVDAVTSSIYLAGQEKKTTLVKKPRHTVYCGELNNVFDLGFERHWRSEECHF